MKKNHTTHMHLLGNPSENYYALGKHDSELFPVIFNQVSTMCSRHHTLAKIFKAGIDAADLFAPKKEGHFGEILGQYAEGLNRPLSEVYFMLLMPEIVASFNKWMPHLYNLMPGCSSLMAYDHKSQGTIHARILDYALGGIFENFERTVLYDFTNSKKIYSFGSVGLPFAGLTAMNEDGLTLALHYKHGHFFDIKGTSIFAIAHSIMEHCSEINDVKKHLKQFSSISKWGLYLTDKKGNALEVDINGRDIHSEKFDLKEVPYLYFNNRPILYDKNDILVPPFGNYHQCKMRTNIVTEKFHDFKWDTNHLDRKVLEELCHVKEKKKDTANDWKLNPVTVASIQAICFNSGRISALSIPGDSPKIFDGKMLETTHLFTDPNTRTIIDRKSKHPHFIEGYRELSRAQSMLDTGVLENSYHHMQMSMAHLKGYQEEWVARFYFAIMQYIYEDHEKDLTYIYDSFMELEGRLPHYLEDHRQLFLQRLGKILGHPEMDRTMHMKHEALKELYMKEYKLNAMAIKLTKHLIIPRMEILDVLYPF